MSSVDRTFLPTSSDVAPVSSVSPQALFTMSVAAGAMSSAGFATATQDLASKYRGIIYGASSALSVVMGSVGTYGTGYILDQLHSWDHVFEVRALPREPNAGRPEWSRDLTLRCPFALLRQISAAVYIVGAAIFVGWYRAVKLFD